MVESEGGIRGRPQCSDNSPRRRSRSVTMPALPVLGNIRLLAQRATAEHSSRVGVAEWASNVTPLRTGLVSPLHCTPRKPEKWARGPQHIRRTSDEVSCEALMGATEARPNARSDALAAPFFLQDRDNGYTNKIPFFLHLK